MSQISSRVMIEQVDLFMNDEYGLSRHESGSIGKVNVGQDIANCLLAIGGRSLLHLSEAIISVCDSDEIDHDFPDVSELLKAAYAYAEAWDRYDNRTESS